MIRRVFLSLVAALAIGSLTLQAGSVPQRAKLGMVITQSDIASQIGFKVIQGGGNAIDAAVATAFALAVTHPTAGNIGGGGFIVYRPAAGEPMAYDFREVGPSRSSPEMWPTDGKYDFNKHHNSHLSVGVPGTVAGLHLAWKEQGSKPWKDLLQPAIAGQLKERKVRNLEALRPDVIATGNIGCLTQIGSGTGLPVVHTVELLDWATGGPRPAALGPPRA